MDGSESEMAGIKQSASRIVTDSTYSAKRHFNAGSSLDRLRYTLGGVVVVVSVIATGRAVAPDVVTSWLAGVCSLGAACIAGLITVYNPGGRAVYHHKIGAEYLALKKDTMQFLDVDLSAPGATASQSKKKLDQFLERLKSIDKESAMHPTPSRAYEEARKGVERGEARY